MLLQATPLSDGHQQHLNTESSINCVKLHEPVVSTDRAACILTRVIVGAHAATRTDVMRNLGVREQNME